MATVCAHLSTPVTATVIESFGPYQEGQQVEVNRVTNRALWFGVPGQDQFIPCTKVDLESRWKIRQLYDEMMGVKRPKLRVSG